MTTTSHIASHWRGVNRGLWAFGMVSLLGGCASTGEMARTALPPNQAALVNYGSALRPRCEKADTKVVNGDREAVCEAFLEAIDGKKVSRLSQETLVNPGMHSLSIHCEYSIIGPADRGAIAREHKWMTMESKLDLPKRYYLWADVVDGQCAVTVSDQKPPPPAPLWKVFSSW